MLQLRSHRHLHHENLLQGREGFSLNRNDRIRQIALYIIYVLFFSTLQVTFPQVLSFRGQTADFMMVFVILTGYLFGTMDGAVIGFAMGFLRDMLASTTLGIGMLILLYIGIISSLLFSKKFHSRAALGFVQVILITFVYKTLGHLLYYFVPLLTVGDHMYLSVSTIMIDSILPQTAINLAISFPMILLLSYLGPYRRGEKRIADEDRLASEEVWQIR